MTKSKSKPVLNKKPSTIEEAVAEIRRSIAYTKAMEAINAARKKETANKVLESLIAKKPHKEKQFRLTHQVRQIMASCGVKADDIYASTLKDGTVRVKLWAYPPKELTLVEKAVKKVYPEVRSVRTSKHTHYGATLVSTTFYFDTPAN